MVRLVRQHFLSLFVYNHLYLLNISTGRDLLVNIFRYNYFVRCFSFSLHIKIFLSIRIKVFSWTLLNFGYLKESNGHGKKKKGFGKTTNQKTTFLYVSNYTYLRTRIRIFFNFLWFWFMAGCVWWTYEF